MISFFIMICSYLCISLYMYHIDGTICEDFNNWKRYYILIFKTLPPFVHKVILTVQIQLAALLQEGEGILSLIIVCPVQPGNAAHLNLKQPRERDTYRHLSCSPHGVPFPEGMSSCASGCPPPPTSM